MRYREAGRNRSRVVGTKADAKLFDAEITRHKRMGDLSTLDSGKQTLAAFAEQTWWPLYVRPTLARSTRELRRDVGPAHRRAARRLPAARDHGPARAPLPG